MDDGTESRDHLQVEIEFRDYRISSGRMDEWIARWKAGVVPLRRDAGFVVLGAWVDRQRDRFIWLLGYDGPDGFAAADERYYASDQRSSLTPNPADLVVETDHSMVHPVL